MSLAGCRHLVEAVDVALGWIDIVIKRIEVSVAEHHEHAGVHALIAQAAAERVLGLVASTTCLSMVCIGSIDGSMSAKPEEAARSHARSERSARSRPRDITERLGPPTTAGGCRPWRPLLCESTRS